MTGKRVQRRDGSFFDAPPGYILRDGEGLVTPHTFMDGATRPAKLTDEQLLDYVRAEMRPKDTSKLSAAQLRRAFVAMKLERVSNNGESALSASEAYIEGAFKALTAELNTHHFVDPGIIETRPDGTMRDAAAVMVDGFPITDDFAKANGYSSARAFVQDQTMREAAYDVMCAELRSAACPAADARSAAAQDVADPWEAFRASLHYQSA